MYQIATAQFSGPIEKLLELIEARKLEVTEFSLAQVTGDFLTHLQNLQSIDPRLLADFIVVASRLLLIKSKALLPGIELAAEEEKEIKDLEGRLRFYQNFKPAINDLKNLWDKKEFSVSRPFLSGRPIIFYPAANITVSDLHTALEKVLETLDQLKIETQTIQPPLVSLEEKIEEILKKLQDKTANFGDWHKEKPRSEIIVMFLALLQLIHSRLIEAEQKTEFSDIIIRKTD